MKLFDRFSCKTSNSAVYVPISVAVCIFLVSFWATSTYAFASVSLQTRGSSAPTSRHTIINSSVHAPVREGARLNNANWRLAFDDEFSGPSVNTNIWNVEDNSPDRYQNGSLNTGIQYYQKEALSLSDGALHIQTNNTARADKQYTSGALTTENKFSFLYGRVDIRARLPRGQGIWPSLWMEDSTTGHEVDIMETINNDTSVYQTYHTNIQATDIYQSYHVNDQATNTTFQCTASVKNPSTNFHVYSLVWTPMALTWYIDNTETCQVTTFVPQTPLYLLINTSVGGAWPGPPDATTVFPQYTDIDYVRVHQTSPLSSCMGLTVSKPLKLSAATIGRGNSLNGTIGYRNACTTPFSITNIAIIVHDASGAVVTFPNTFDPVTLLPRQLVQFTATLPIASTAPIGQWYALTSFQTPDGQWHADGSNLLYFNVTA